MQSGSDRFTTVPLKPESDEKCVKYLKCVNIFEFSSYKQDMKFAEKLTAN